MASKNAVSLLQSIQEGLAKLTAEVDSMENKISVGPVEVSAYSNRVTCAMTIVFIVAAASWELYLLGCFHK